MNRTFLLMCGLLLLIACNGTSQEKKTELNVLILGNSITSHPPLREAGWYGTWGMAASSAEKDFVHVLINKIKTGRPKLVVDYRALNIAYWEMNFNFDFKDVIESKYMPDVLIIRLGENLQPEYFSNNNYEAALTQLINKFKGPKAHVLVTGNFWPAGDKDAVQQKVAIDNGYPYVPLSDLANDNKNKAVDTHQGGVGQHPSDLGMYNIADRIYTKLIEQKWF